jgi:hypothetical protein
MLYCNLRSIRIPTPLLLSVEIWYISYLGEKRLLNPLFAVFYLKSDKKIIVVLRASIAVIFLLCLGQFVEIFMELQF